MKKLMSLATLLAMVTLIAGCCGKCCGSKKPVKKEAHKTEAVMKKAPDKKKSCKSCG